MYPKAYGAWFKAGIDAWSLGVEASTVIALRMTKLAAGGEAASREAELMVTEKVEAAADLQAKLAVAPLTMTPLGSTRKAIKHYRGKVAANRRRLIRRN